MVKVKLIGFDSVAAEVRGRCEIPFPGPCQESPERPAVGVGGSLRVGTDGEVFEKRLDTGREGIGFGSGDRGGGDEAAFPSESHSC